jgi:peroxiredoxin Q/BCP
MAIQVGDRAPVIHTPGFDLAQQRGKRVVLFFFPKADTPGCTKEACEFRDASKTFAKRDAVIVGISPDQTAAHEKFAAKYHGVWKEKSMYGRKYMGIERTTFVIDEKGKIAKIFSKVKPEGHAAQVLEALAAD